VETTRWAAALDCAADCPASGKYGCALGAIAEGQNIPSAELPNAEVVLVVQQNQLFHHAHR